MPQVANIKEIGCEMKKSVMVLTLCAVALLQVACSKSDDQSKPINSDTAASPATRPVSTAAQPVVEPLKTYDGPLGLAMGVPVDILLKQLQFTEPTSETPNVYFGAPPKPAPGFNRYFVVATAGQGICKISAIATVDVVNATGDQIKSETDRIAEMVELKYGKPTKKYDFASQDVYRRNPQFFMMALKEQAVTYAYSWVSKSGNAALPNDLDEIEVAAAASNSDHSWVRLSYVFKNNTMCDAEIKKQKSTNL